MAELVLEGMAHDVMSNTKFFRMIAAIMTGSTQMTHLNLQMTCYGATIFKAERSSFKISEFANAHMQTTKDHPSMLSMNTNIITMSYVVCL